MTDATLLSCGRYPPYAQIPHASHWRDDLPQEISRLALTLAIAIIKGLKSVKQ
jgi:hypothetical protein